MLDRIGHVVLNTRQGAGRSIEELAQDTGVQPSVLEALEAGKPGITTTELGAVARTLGLDANALLSGREELRPVPSIFMRHQGLQDFDHDDDDALDDALEEGRALGRLRHLLKKSPLAVQAGKFETREASSDTPEAPARDGYHLAREVRRWLRDASGPLGDLRNLIEERFGVAVVVRHLASSKVTGVSIRSGAAATIILGAGDPRRAANPLLARVILAHELCHILFDPEKGGLQIVIDADLDRKTNAAEQRARAFAAELLLPLEGLTALLGPTLRLLDQEKAAAIVAKARSHFGTPHEIAANHLCNHGFIDRRLREWLEADKTSFAGAEPVTTLPEPGAPSFLLREIIKSAYDEDITTDGEARALLGLDRLAPLPWDPPGL